MADKVSKDIEAKSKAALNQSQLLEEISKREPQRLFEDAVKAAVANKSGAKKERWIPSKHLSAKWNSMNPKISLSASTRMCKKTESLGATKPQLLKARVQRAKESPKAKTKTKGILGPQLHQRKGKAKAKAKTRLQLQKVAKVHTVAIKTKRSQKEMARQRAKARARTRRARENRVCDGEEFCYTPAGKDGSKVQSYHARCQSQ